MAIEPVGGASRAVESLVLETVIRILEVARTTELLSAQNRLVDVAIGTLKGLASLWPPRAEPEPEPEPTKAVVRGGESAPAEAEASVDVTTAPAAPVEPVPAARKPSPRLAKAAATTKECPRCHAVKSILAFNGDVCRKCHYAARSGRRDGDKPERVSLHRMRRCAACGEAKGATAFRGGSDTCAACRHKGNGHARGQAAAAHRTRGAKATAAQGGPRRAALEFRLGRLEDWDEPHVKRRALDEAEEHGKDEIVVTDFDGEAVGVYEVEEVKDDLALEAAEA